MNRDVLRRLARLLLLPLLGLAMLAGCATLDERQREWIFQPSDRTWWGGLAAAEGMQDVWIDFDSADQMIRAGAPEKAAWGIALGLTVTLVWLYLEILRLLSYFYSSDR